MMYITAPVFFLVISTALCAPERVQSTQEVQDTHEIDTGDGFEDQIIPMDKRFPHYNFGLGKRAYSYVSEYKRLPVYNFGLGKRSRPYSFGLGKRSVDDYEEVEPDYQAISEFYDDIEPNNEKRARPYSFGLGKRFDEDPETDLRKRLAKYNFGLGKRAKAYNFGLGKRLNSKFNFGLGKREKFHRFNFGLGKRSDGIEESNSEDMEM